MIELKRDTLVFRFPEVHEDAECRIHFQRTLRIPDDNRSYPLPPGLGDFPLEHVDDYADRLPEAWKTHGGVFLPMYQSEAMWIAFNGEYPCAVKIAAGKINAVTGEGWSNKLSDAEQDYVVVPDQPWLDGFAVNKGLIRQFVAMPLDEGYTAEEQITGEASHGGIQIVVYPMKKERYEQWLAEKSMNLSTSPDADSWCYDMEPDMGLAPGGLMRQEIYEDEFGYDAWDQTAGSRCFVHIADSLSYKKIIGVAPPTKPPTAEQYTNAGLPWFEYYDDELKALEGSPVLAGLDGVAAKKIKKGSIDVEENEQVTPLNLIKITAKEKVREGTF